MVHHTLHPQPRPNRLSPAHLFAHSSRSLTESNIFNFQQYGLVQRSWITYTVPSLQLLPAFVLILPAWRIIFILQTSSSRRIYPANDTRNQENASEPRQLRKTPSSQGGHACHHAIDHRRRTSQYTTAVRDKITGQIEQFGWRRRWREGWVRLYKRLWGRRG